MKATIIATVYNQAPFLTEMIESVVKQNTKYDFEFIIANDCSSDNSEQIISEYAQKYPFIKAINNRTNLGFIRNYTQCLKMAKGKYIACIGGDDYWIHPDKLEMQINFLDENPDFGMVHTQFDELFMYPKPFQRQYQKNALKDGALLHGHVFRKIATNNTINAITVCFVKDIIQSSGLIEQFENEYYKFEDLPMWLYISRRFKVGYIDVSTVCYRRNKDSASHFNCVENYIAFMKYVRKISLSFMTKEEINSEEFKEAFLQRDCVTYTYAYFKKGDRHNFFRYYKLLKNKSFDGIVMAWLLRLRLDFLFR